MGVTCDSYDKGGEKAAGEREILYHVGAQEGQQRDIRCVLGTRCVRGRGTHIASHLFLVLRAWKTRSNL